MCDYTHNMSLHLENSANNVRYEFKILYAIGIVLIVMGHCHGGGISLFNNFFPYSSFHLALFMFASGYFYKTENELQVRDFIFNKAKRLIIPLYLWNMFYAIIIHIIKIYGFFPSVHVTLKTLLINPIMDGHQFLLNLGGWFVIPLFMIHVINIFVRKICLRFNIKINEFVYFSICLLFGMLGVLLSARGLNKEWYLVLDRILYFLPFYSLGILYKKYEKYDKINNLLYFGIIFILALIIIYKYGSMPSFTPSWAQFYTKNVIKPFYIGIIGIAFWLRVSKILRPAIGNSKPLNIVADNTYTIMINHLLGMKFLGGIFALLHKYSNICSGFDMCLYKTLWNYCYIPHGSSQFLILYVIFGIIFSIILQKFADKLIGKLKVCVDKLLQLFSL